MKKSIQFRLLILALALIITAASQALMIATAQGATIWSTAALNIVGALLQTDNLQQINTYNGTAILLLSTLCGLINLAISPDHDLPRFLRNLIFVVPFSYFIQFFVPFWQGGLSAIEPFIHNALVFRGLLILICMVALAGISAGVSMYQRANLILHPYDDLAFILRFDYFHGNAATSQIVGFSIPGIITVVAILLNHGRMLSIGFGTIWAFFMQGAFTGIFDKVILPNFKHQALTSPVSEANHQ